MIDAWYEEHWKNKETDNFLKWWLEYYGVAADYENVIDEQEDYWIRRGFALAGWLAALENKDGG